MTAAGVVAAVALIAATILCAVVSTRLARSTRLGPAHPAVAWLVLHTLLFGIGGVLLALDGRPAAAGFTAAGIVAFGLGAWLSATVAVRRPVDRDASAAPPYPRDSIRLGVAVLAAILSVALVVPLLIATGVPFLVEDITAARSGLSGLVVQPLRVALPGLAIVLLLRAADRGSADGADLPGKTISAAIAVVAIALFDLVLASRYLLAELGAALLIAWWLSGRRVPRPALVVLGVVAFTLFVVVQALRAWDLAAPRPVEFLAQRTVDRVLTVQPRTLEALMDVIPDEEPFFGGLTWLRRLGASLGRPDIPNLGYWIYPRVVGAAGATTGYAAPGLLGEAWANFGWFGALLLGGLGVAAERIGALAAVRRSLVADVAAAALLTLFLARTHALGLLGLGVAAMLVLAWRYAVAPAAGVVGTIGATLRWRA